MIINALAFELDFDIHGQRTPRDGAAYVRNIPWRVVDHAGNRPVRPTQGEHSHLRSHLIALILKCAEEERDVITTVDPAVSHKSDALSDLSTVSLFQTPQTQRSNAI
jgi:hypothetical protein